MPCYNIVKQTESPSNFSLLCEFHKFKRFNCSLSLLSSKAYLEKDIGICRTFLIEDLHHVLVFIMLLLNVARVQS